MWRSNSQWDNNFLVPVSPALPVPDRAVQQHLGHPTPCLQGTGGHNHVQVEKGHERACGETWTFPAQPLQGPEVMWLRTRRFSQAVLSCELFVTDQSVDFKDFRSGEIFEAALRHSCVR